LLFLAATAATAGSLSCSDVKFQLAPFTPQKVELLSSPQEHVSVVRWRVDASPPLEGTRFELWGPDGYRPISFADSVYPGGIVACADGQGSCAQYVTREKLTPPPHTHLVRAVHDSYGTLVGTEVKSRTLSETVTIDSFFRPRNDMVYINIKTDQIGADGPYIFPRTFEYAMWPTPGACLSDVEPPEGVSFSTLEPTGGFAPEMPLTTDGLYCVAARPIPVDGGHRSLAEVRIATWPEVETIDTSFEPPVEVSPITYQIVFDLEIYFADRCADAMATIESVVRNNLRPFGVTVPVRQLPTINLAQNGDSSCSQANQARKVPAEAMAQEIKQAITEFPQVHQQFHLLYFNNLDAPLPGTLNESWRVLFDALGSPPGYDLLVFPWMFNQGLAALTPLELGWNVRAWSTADDPGLREAIVDYATRLPYRTQTHDSLEPVPFMDADAVTAHAGQLMKICTSSPSAVPVKTKPELKPITTRSWAISPDDPPAYLVNIQNQIAAPAGYFVETRSLVRYQICSRYCTGHPYVNASNGPGQSWADEPYCAKDN
jgi:hypothetical protein